MVEQYEEDQEYVAHQNEYSEAYPIRKPNTFSQIIGKLLRNRVVLIVIGIIFFMYVVFKVLNFITHQSILKDKANVSSKTILPVKQPIVNTLPTDNNSQTNIGQNKENGSLQQQMIDQNRQAVLNLNGRLTNVEQVMTNMDKKFADLAQIMQRILFEMRTKQLAKMEKARNKAIGYSVQAVIPGRAWLRGPNVITMTVIVGSTIPGLGKVTFIDPIRGNVVTDRGVKLRFAVDDR